MRIASLSLACAGVVLAGSLALAHPPHHPRTARPGQEVPKQPPPGQAPRNLQLLPPDIGQAELIGVMQGFSRALGVECSYCHTRDFASDENPHKNVARGMMRMTARINDELLPAVAGLHARPGGPRVTCQTCHDGSPQPGVEPPPPSPPTVPVPPAPPMPAPHVHTAPDTPAQPH
jgi:hypothetical protein